MKISYAWIVVVALLVSSKSVSGQTCPSQASRNSHFVATSAAASQEKDIVASAVDAGNFTTLVAAVKAAGLVDTLKGAGPFTVFAPSDAAFEKLPAGTVENLLKPENKDQLVSILKYHVVPGKVSAAEVVKITSAKTVQGQPVSIKVANNTVMIDGAKVITTDIMCSNGVIHVIDAVMIPKQVSNIVETAVKAGNFKTLTAALKAAGLVDALQGDGPFTVFAPTDEAFAKLPAGTVENLLKPENKNQLVKILTYHVVSGDVRAADVVKLKSAKSLQGNDIAIAVNQKTVTGAGSKVDKVVEVMVDGAKVVATDIECKNGVIHVIDSVILPK